jgi:hypothetical protein
MNRRRTIAPVWMALIALLAQLMTPAASLAAMAAMAANPAACADMPGMTMSGMDMSAMDMPQMDMSGDMAGMDMSGMDMSETNGAAKAPADKGKGVGGMPCCQDCLAPATAALPASLATPIPISYATAYVHRVAFVRYRAPPARAPPRPPGQGPPTSSV